MRWFPPLLVLAAACYAAEAPQPPQWQPCMAEYVALVPEALRSRLRLECLLWQHPALLPDSPLQPSSETASSLTLRIRLSDDAADATSVPRKNFWLVLGGPGQSFAAIDPSAFVNYLDVVPAADRARATIYVPQMRLVHQQRPLSSSPDHSEASPPSASGDTELPFLESSDDFLAYLRGSGRTDRRLAMMSTRLVTEDLLRIVDHENPSTAATRAENYLHGMSYGGLVAMEAVRLRPTLFSAVLLDTPTSPKFVLNNASQGWLAFLDETLRICEQAGPKHCPVSRQVLMDAVLSPNASSVAAFKRVFTGRQEAGHQVRKLVRFLCEMPQLVCRRGHPLTGQDAYFEPAFLALALLKVMGERSENAEYVAFVLESVRSAIGFAMTEELRQSEQVNDHRIDLDCYASLSDFGTDDDPFMPRITFGSTSSVASSSTMSSSHATISSNPQRPTSSHNIAISSNPAHNTSGGSSLRPSDGIMPTSNSTRQAPNGNPLALPVPAGRPRLVDLPEEGSFGPAVNAPAAPHLIADGHRTLRSHSNLYVAGPILLSEMWSDDFSTVRDALDTFDTGLMSVFGEIPPFLSVLERCMEELARLPWFQFAHRARNPNQLPGPDTTTRILVVSAGLDYRTPWMLTRDLARDLKASLGRPAQVLYRHFSAARHTPMFQFGSAPGLLALLRDFWRGTLTTQAQLDDEPRYPSSPVDWDTLRRFFFANPYVNYRDVLPTGGESRPLSDYALLIGTSLIVMLTAIALAIVLVVFIRRRRKLQGRSV